MEPLSMRKGTKELTSLPILSRIHLVMAFARLELGK